jgi:hypothetical protein
MKKYSQIHENCVTSDVNPGNVLKLGVTNHLTPINNILTNVRNLWSTFPIVAAVAEDGFSLKLHSSKFTTQEETKKCLTDWMMCGTPLMSYINQQGLDALKIVCVGQYCVCYFSPSDIKAAVPGLEAEPQSLPCTEQYVFNIDEAEMTSIFEADDDEELKSPTPEKAIEIAKMQDKVKAAKQFELLVTNEIELPRNYYFAGVKSKDGEESIALRWRYTFKRPHNKTEEAVRSLFNIYGTGKEAIWVGDFDAKAYFQLPDDVKTLIENILELIGAEKSKNPCVWTLGEDESKDDDKDDDKDKKDDDKKDDKKDDGGDDLLSGGDDKKEDDKKDDDKKDDAASLLG